MKSTRLLNLSMVATVFFIPQAIGPCGPGGGNSNPKPPACTVIIGFPNDTTPPVEDKSGPYDLVDTWTNPVSALMAACTRKWKALKIDQVANVSTGKPAVSIYLKVPDSITRRGTYTWYSPEWANGIERREWETAYLNVVT